MSQANPLPVHAYVITLQKLDSAKVLSIQQRLTSLGYRVVLVEGVRGAELSAQEYFTRTNFWRSATGKTMTPGELGCAMSHEKALRMMADLGDGCHLVLEDDFIATDEALTWAARVGQHVNPGTLLHLGGQEHLPRFYRYVRGKPIAALDGLSHVCPSDLEYLRCSVAYLLHVSTAKKMSELMSLGLFIADDFGYARQRGAIEDIWFRWVISHPVGQETSAIESERRLLGQSTKRHWSYRISMNWARLWRHLVSPPSAFLNKQQPKNQMPVLMSEQQSATHSQ